MLFAPGGRIEELLFGRVTYEMMESAQNRQRVRRASTNGRSAPE